MSEFWLLFLALTLIISSFCPYFWQDALGISSCKIMTIPSIQFNFLTAATLKDRNRLRKFIGKMVKKEGKQLAELQYIFCSDAYLLAINRQYLQHDFFTDIITFDLSENGQPINAEIYISVERVRDNAANYNSSFREELHRVIFHGVLHLCGYKDKKLNEAETMRQMEDKWLKGYLGI
jgi:probable rRNA maturation factor